MNENYFDNDAQSRNAHDESREGYGQPQHERNTGNDAPQNNESRPRAKRPRFNSSSRVTSSSNFTRNTTPQRGNYGGQGQRPYRQRTDYRDNPYDQPRTRYGSYGSDYDEHSAGYRPRPAQGATAGPRRPYRPQYEQEGRETEIKLSLTKDGQTQIFYFEKETERGEEYIRIRVGDKNGSQSYRVSIETDADGNSHYVYEYAGKRTQMDRFDRYDD